LFFRKYRHGRRYISLAPATRKKGRFEWLFGPPNVERVLANLPRGLQELDVSGLDIVRLPDRLPARLIRLRARNCKQLEAIDRMPDSLIYVDLGGCEKLTRLPPDLPSSLQELSVISTAITRLPKLPAGIRSVDAYRCRNLMAISAEWPRFSGDGGTLQWLNLRKTPAVFWVSGNLPNDTLRQLREHGFADYRHKDVHGKKPVNRELSWPSGQTSA
jgi:hypothetical protein